MDEARIFAKARQRVLNDVTGMGVDHHMIAVAAETERERIAKWLREDLTMNRAADGFVLNCLADAIERGDHEVWYKRRPE